VNERLAAALRRNTARGMLPEFLATTSAALGRRIEESDLIPLEESDNILRAFEGRMKEQSLGGKAKFVDEILDDDVALVRQAAALRETIPDEEMALFRSGSKWCGAIQSTAHEVLSHLTKLVSPDQEDVIACSGNQSLGIFCSLDSRKGEESPVYHLILWSD